MGERALNESGMTWIPGQARGRDVSVPGLELVSTEALKTTRREICSRNPYRKPQVNQEHISNIHLSDSTYIF